MLRNRAISLALCDGEILKYPVDNGARSGGVRGCAVIDWGEMNVRNSVALLCLPRCM